MDYKSLAHSLVSRMTLAEKMAQMKFEAPAIPRLGVPAYTWWNEALHGVARCGTATVFPQAIALAAAFDPALIEKVGDAVSTEARAKYNQFRTSGSTAIYQGLTCWSPNINIFRDPRWGRGQETYGEDPYLTSVTGAAYVCGLQGKDPVYRKVDATCKHFAVHSGPESLRHGFDVKVSDKDLWETYLAAFRYCVRNAGVDAVMGAYNAVGGVPCCANRQLLQTDLREKMGFDGYVVSDCGAINDINAFHKYTENQAQSAAAAVKAGCDLNCGGAYAYLQVAYGAGLVTEEDITRSVERLFAARYRLGMLDAGEGAPACPYDKIGPDQIDSPAHAEINLEAARESVVLLKNDGVLPLRKDRRYAVIGPNADHKLILLGNYNGTPSRWVTPLRGIQDKVSGEGSVVYAHGCHHFHERLSGFEEAPEDEAVLAARSCDAVILIMGLDPTMEGEEGDAYNGTRGGDRADIELPQVQTQLYRKVKEAAGGRPVIFVNVSGSCVALAEQDRECNAVVQLFYCGARGGEALADVLFGDVCPSGRLPVTFYRGTGELPPFEDYSMKDRTYRYFGGEVVYPFGYGLSYCDFKYGPLTFEKHADGSACVSFDLNNSGTCPASEAVTLYLTQDGDENQPKAKLIYVNRFAVAPGGTCRVTCPVDREQLMYTGEDGELYVRRGEYRVCAGGFCGKYIKSSASIAL